MEGPLIEFELPELPNLTSTTDGEKEMTLKNWLLLFILLVLAQAAGAQLCQGSLGDPIVNITFGAGANPGPQLPTSVTNYQYKADDCPNDGFYTLRNSTSHCFTGWHSLTSDHTGNPNGYFMLVNASQQPSAFYVDTVDLQCSNTTYEFAAWVVNMNNPFECNGNPNRPNLTFTIEKTDGTVLKSYNSGDIAPQTNAEWKQYGFFFSTPSAVSRIVLRITNNAQGGCGNDLAMDDITFSPCGPLLNAGIVGDGTVKNFCEGEATPQTLSCTVAAGYSNPHYQWQQRVNNAAAWTDIPGANDLIYTADLSAASAGTYQYRLAVAQTENVNTPVCRVNSNAITLQINSKPAPAAANNGPLCQNATLALLAKDGSQYNWKGPDGFTASGATVNVNDAQPSQSGMYYVEVVNDAGCRQTDSTVVVIHPRPVAAANPDAVSICEGATITLTGSGGDAYAWSPAAHLLSPNSASTKAFPVDSTQYRLIVSNSFQCTDTAYVQVNVSKKPVASAGPDRYLILGQSAQLSGSVGGTNVYYNWSPSLFINDTTALQPLVNPQADITYTLQVTSNDGCGTATDAVKVHVYKDVYVPNAFTPNNDGLNDTWRIPALNAYADYEILVFDRYGQVVYQSKANQGWDGSFKGKALPTGVYPYIISIKQTGAKLTGWVAIVR